MSRSDTWPVTLVGHPLLHFAEVGSTSDEARARAERGDLQAGAVVVAERQTAGHGRRGRTWVTLPGRSLSASVLLAPPALARPSRMAGLGAVAACRALSRAGVADVAIKWPNDLMRGEGKLGGMLVEYANAPAGGRLVVFGIGINLQLAEGDLPPELRAETADADLPPAARIPLLAALLEELDSALAESGTAADADRGREYCSRAWLPGRLVRLQSGSEILTARVGSVTPDGDLVLADGRLIPGETAQILEVERGTAQPARTSPR